MESILREGDIVTVDNYGKFAVVKTFSYLTRIFHYIIKMQNSNQEPNVLFVYEEVDKEDNLNLVVVEDEELIKNLVNALKNKL
jgi:hypothetical protein